MHNGSVHFAEWKVTITEGNLISMSRAKRYPTKCEAVQKKG